MLRFKPDVFAAEVGGTKDGCLLFGSAVGTRLEAGAAEPICVHQNSPPINETTISAVTAHEITLKRFLFRKSMIFPKVLFLSIFSK